MIRALGPADLPALRTLRTAALTDSPQAFGSTPEEDAAITDAGWFPRLALPNVVFGALVGGSLVGMAGFAREGGRKREHRGSLWGVFVAPPHRGAGLSRALVEAVAGHAARHALVLEASVVVSNSAARALYASMGFVEYGLHRRALRVDDAFLDEALIALDLPSWAAENAG